MLGSRRFRANAQWVVPLHSTVSPRCAACVAAKSIRCLLFAVPACPVGGAPPLHCVTQVRCLLSHSDGCRTRLRQAMHPPGQWICGVD